MFAILSYKSVRRLNLLLVWYIDAISSRYSLLQTESCYKSYPISANTLSSREMKWKQMPLDEMVGRLIKANRRNPVFESVECNKGNWDKMSYRFARARSSGFYVVSHSLFACARKRLSCRWQSENDEEEIKIQFLTNA